MGDKSTELVTYLPASLLRALAARPSATLPWCHEVDGTMVMADLSGFTALSERLAKLGDEGAERLTAVINSFFEKMLKTAARYGGDTLTFGGDAILLLFDGEEHAARAVAASLDMLKQVDRSAAVEGGDGKVKIGMSVGAHSDTFVLGAAGLADERAHLFVLGRGAEMTALAEAQAERGQLAVSPSTKKLLSGRLKSARAGDFWRVNEFTGEGLRRGAAEDLPASRQSRAAECSPAPQLDLRQLAPFLPPYARPDVEGGGGRGQHEPEHRRAVIVFVNILGLNDVIASAGVQAALEQLQTYSAMLTRIAAKHHGFVVSSDIATQGSKLVITFGTPVAHEYAPANAARFALDLAKELRESGLDLRHKIGLNGGHVFAGDVGPAFRRQYTVMGDAVNLAARLMSAAKPGETLISRTLLDYVSTDLCARVLEPIKVKGKAQPVGVCVLEEERRGGRQIRGGAGSGHVQGRLFGRRAELDLIKRAWEETRSGAGRVILVEGDAGVGKTRLLEEVLHGMRDAGRVIRAACFEHLQAAPFTPWVDALYALLGATPEDSTERRTKRAQERLGRLPAFLEFGSLLNPLLNLALPGSNVVGSLDSQTRRSKLFDLVADILMDAADESGFVLVIEDLHWMDESSTALSAQLAKRVGQAPILLLFTARPTESALGVNGEGVSRLALTELSQPESLAMVRDALDVAELPSEVGEAIYAKTKGNPLFLEEVIHSLQAPGVLERILTASSVARAAELAALEIPDRVQGLLMSRIDRLAPDTREVLKAGSVVGRSFDVTLLGTIDDPLLEQVSLERAFDELIKAALAVPGEDGPRSSLTFRHALVQDVAYDSLPFMRRRRLHGEIARYFESVQATPDHALLVHHYSRAGDSCETRIHGVRASEDSVRLYSHLDAIDYLTLALSTVRGPTVRDACVRSRLEELIGDSQQTLGRYDVAIEAFMSARRRWASPVVRRASPDALEDISPLEDADARASLLCWKTAVAMHRGPGAFRRALRWLDIAERALPIDRGGLAARILIAKGVCLSRLNRNQDSLAHADKGLALARQEGNRDLVAYGSTVRSLALSQLGQLEQAVEAGREAVAAYEEVGDLSGLARSHGNLGFSYQLSDRPREALEEMEKSLSLYAKLGDMSGVGFQHLNVGATLMQLGETDEGLRHLQQTIDLRGTGSCPPLQVGWALVLVAQARLSAGDAEGADEALREGREILESIDAQSFLLDTYIVDAEVRLAQGDAEDAERRCLKVLAAARAADAAPVEGEALRVLGRIRLVRGHPESAVTDLQACLALAEETGSNYARAQALAMLAEAQAACAEADPACEDLLGEAIRLFEKMGVRGELKKALELRERIASRV